MGPSKPEQLQINFGRVDPISERFPRRHDERHIRTFGEHTSDFATGAVRFLGSEKGKLTRAVIVLGALMAATGLTVFKVDEKVDDYQESKKAPYYEPSNPGDYIECAEDAAPVVITNDNTLEILMMADFLGSKSAVSGEIFGYIIWDSINSPEEEVFGILSDWLDEQDIDLKVELPENVDALVSEKETSIQRTGLNLLEAIASIPKSFFEYNNPKIRVVPKLLREKSVGQLDYERAHASDPESVSTMYEADGDYDESTNVVRIAYATLFNQDRITQVLWHEVVGHGVMMKQCDPLVDKDLQALNDSTMIGFTYLPEYMRTDAQNGFFKSRLVTAEGYGGTNPFEDVATLVERLPYLDSAGSSSEEGVLFSVNPTNGSVVDEKMELLIKRLKLIEPDIEKYLKYIQQ